VQSLAIPGIPTLLESNGSLRVSGSLYCLCSFEQTLLQGMAASEIFLLAVELAVSAILEGLPVALTVALAVGMQRMAKRNVVVLVMELHKRVRRYPVPQ